MSGLLAWAMRRRFLALAGKIDADRARAEAREREARATVDAQRQRFRELCAEQDAKTGGRAR